MIGVVPTLPGSAVTWDERLPDLSKKIPIPESAIVNQCIRTLWQMGCFVWRNNTGMWKNHGKKIRYGKVGSADIIGITPSGRFISCECKTEKNKQTDEQKAFQARIEEKGGIYILARSVDDLIARQNEIMGR